MWEVNDKRVSDKLLDRWPGLESRKEQGSPPRHRVQTGRGTSDPMGTRVPFHGGKAAGRESDHSRTSSCSHLYERNLLWILHATTSEKLMHKYLLFPEPFNLASNRKGAGKDVS
jgi:hypothetical protein